MKKQRHFWVAQQGMTLIEVIVTIGVLSIFFIGTLGMYTRTYRHLQTRDSLISIVDDSDRIMSYIGDDIRHAHQFLNDYQGDDSHIVVAAMKIRQGGPEAPMENLVVYFLDADRPNRLIRSVRTKNNTVTMEISTQVHTLKVVPKEKKLFEVQLSVQDQVAGKQSTTQVLSQYAIRY